MKHCSSRNYQYLRSEFSFFATEELEEWPALKFSTCSSNREYLPLIKRSNPFYCPATALPPLVPLIVPSHCDPPDNFPENINGPRLFLHDLSCGYRHLLSMLSCLRGNKQTVKSVTKVLEVTSSPAPPPPPHTHTELTLSVSVHVCPGSFSPALLVVSERRKAAGSILL